MTALDTNVLVRYLVRDDAAEFEAVRALLESLTIECPGYVCREVIVELVWVLERSYGYSRGQIATILEELAASEELVVEAADEVARAAFLYRRGDGGFSDLMIIVAGKRAGVRSLCTLDRKLSRLEDVSLPGDHVV